MYSYFDTHSHLNLSEFDTDREELIAELATASIGTITIGVDLETSRSAVALAEKHPHLFACIGLHPVDDPTEGFDSVSFRALAFHRKTVAIGECGLDYFRLDGEMSEEKKRQKEIFNAQIDLAKETGKPLMLHCRPSKGSMDAYEDALTLLEEAKQMHPQLLGNAHFFVGNKDIAKRFMALGFTMSFPGVITFSSDYDDVIRMLPLESILSETDAPYATPVPYRGKRNSPLYVKEVAVKIAEIRNEDPELVQTALVENAVRMFHLT